MHGGLEHLGRITTAASRAARRVTQRQDHFVRSSGDGPAQRLTPPSSGDQSSAEQNDAGRYVTGKGVFVSKGRFGSRDRFELVVWKECGHGQRYRPVSRIAAGRHSIRFAIDAIDRGSRIRSPSDPLQHRRRDWAAIDAIGLPPLHVTRKNVRGIERLLVEQAPSQFEGHTSWAAVPVSSREAEESSSTTILPVSG